MALRLLLAGAGHAHLHLLHRAGALRAAGLEPVLVSPARFQYSGLASAVLAGAVPADANGIDVAALAAARGVTHLEGMVARVDLAARRLHLADGRWRDFDFASFNIGSVAAGAVDLSAAPDVWTAKPLGRLTALRARLEAAFAATRRCPALVVAGSGATAHEIAASLAALAWRHGLAPRVTLLGPAPRDWAPEAALRSLRRHLAGQGITIMEGRVATRQHGHCGLADGATLPCDLLVLATGLRAPPLMSTLGLPVDALGRLRLTTALHSVADPAIFAAGDCAAIEGHTRPMAGVFGVRAAPALRRNLAAQAAGRRLSAHVPQRRWLAILDLGDGTGLAVRGAFWWRGHSALWLKRHLDLGFIRRMRADHAAPAAGGSLIVTTGPMLSVIIPLAPGEAEQAGLLAALHALPPGQEVILVRAAGQPVQDAGGWPRHLTLRQAEAPAGRARQMNAGAAMAGGDWLWFLHADSLLTPATLPRLLSFIRRGAPALGWFDLRFRADGPWPTRLNAWGANRRSAWLGLPFGDQGLVLPAASFRALGGYDETAPYGEDHLLVWAAHTARLPVLRVGAGLSTSARKYARGGWLGTTWLHWRLTAIQAWQAWRRLRAARAAGD